MRISAATVYLQTVTSITFSYQSKYHCKRGMTLTWWITNQPSLPSSDTLYSEGGLTALTWRYQMNSFTTHISIRVHAMWFSSEAMGSHRLEGFYWNDWMVIWLWYLSRIKLTIITALCVLIATDYRTTYHHVTLIFFSF